MSSEEVPRPEGESPPLCDYTLQIHFEPASVKDLMHEESLKILDTAAIVQGFSGQRVFDHYLTADHMVTVLEFRACTSPSPNTHNILLGKLVLCLHDWLQIAAAEDLEFDRVEILARTSSQKAAQRSNVTEEARSFMGIAAAEIPDGPDF